MRILHVAESFGGGVATAMAEYVQSTPEAEHYLLYGDRTQVVPDAHFHYVWTRPLGSGASAMRTIRRVVRELRPDVVHAQSSFAGVYVRLALSAKRVRIVYTPHCFAFERKDISGRSRRAFLLAERALALNTSMLAGCSPHEADLGRKWLGEDRSLYVPNVARVGLSALPSTDRAVRMRPLIVGLGRLDAQKDPGWFVEVAACMGDHVDLLWIGGGQPEQEVALRSAGIEVTGWISRDEAMGHLSEADCFVMTSRWEGFPMAVLEASALNVPVVLRRLTALPDAPDDVTADTPAAAAERALAAATDAEARTHNLNEWAAYLEENSPAVQRERLLVAYGMRDKTDFRG